MARRTAPLTLDTLDDLPSACRGCVFWELDAVAEKAAQRMGDTPLEKEAWLSQLLLDWGSAGTVVYVDGDAAGYCLYAPAAYLPRIASFPTAPVSADAVVLATARVLPRYGGLGIGKTLVQAAAKDAMKRGFRAMEAFGDSKWAEPQCVLPTEFLQAAGFVTVREHPVHPRLRLDLRSAVTWRSEVEAAVERLMGAIRPEPVPPRPAAVRDSL
ncbi:MAG TPA: GNAT family N-acetyltransferase [Kribbellaceae bacterium]|jgi:GNAT superfamily N-acetyltransferase